MDRILIRGLSARSFVGVGDDERKERQEVRIDIDLLADLKKAGLSDRLDDTIDYRVVKKRVLGLVESAEFRLIEAMAERVASICLEDPRVIEARVEVVKPGAQAPRSTGVEITRRRG